MIKLLRIDDRLLHGQVAFSWSTTLSITDIIVVNDAVAADETTKMMLGIAKPRGTKLTTETVQKGIEAVRSHVKDGHKVMVIVNNMKDAYDIVTAVPEITSINFGGKKENRNIPSKRFTGSVTLTLEEVELCKQLAEKNVELEIRQTPDNKKMMLTPLL